LIRYPINRYPINIKHPGRLACLHQNQEEHVAIAHAQSGVLGIPVVAPAYRLVEPVTLVLRG
jgi:hypothetical protein